VPSLVHTGNYFRRPSSWPAAWILQSGLSMR